MRNVHGLRRFRKTERLESKAQDSIQRLKQIATDNQLTLTELLQFSVSQEREVENGLTNSSTRRLTTLLDPTHTVHKRAG